MSPSVVGTNFDAKGWGFFIKSLNKFLLVLGYTLSLFSYDFITLANLDFLKLLNELKFDPLRDSEISKFSIANYLKQPIGPSCVKFQN